MNCPQAQVDRRVRQNVIPEAVRSSLRLERRFQSDPEDSLQGEQGLKFLLPGASARSREVRC